MASSLYHHGVTLSLLINSGLSYTPSDMTTVTPACFQVPFAWKCHIPCYTSSQCLCRHCKRSFLQTATTWIFFSLNPGK